VPTRRHAFAGLAALLAGCAALPAAGALQRLADGVYLAPGSGGSADAANLGRIGNCGFVVGPAGVIAIDTGTSYAHGQALLAAVRSVTDRPVRLALVTHTQPEFLFGGAAFRERGVPVRMHRRCAGLMASRCETCLKRLRETLGAAALAGTTMYTPDELFDADHDVGAAGRPLRVLYFGHASGPGDIAVHDVASGVLFSGGLVESGRVPDIQDSDLAGWRRALAALRALAPRIVVPAHGPAGGPALIDAVDGYLRALEARVRRFVEDAGSLLDVADAVELPDYAHWDQYQTHHRRNASVAFLRIERELLFKE
jgi:glyoxylase-like metal-dependent hydrolase (beta-lactamase superfamily II)